MKLSKQAAKSITWGSYIAIAGCLAGSLYFQKPSPEEMRISEIEKEKPKMGQEILQCIPRQKETSLSDRCNGLIIRYDSLEREKEYLKTTSEYRSAKAGQERALYLTLLAIPFAAACILGQLQYSRRVKEEKAKAL
mgnify:FL=1